MGLKNTAMDEIIQLIMGMAKGGSLNASSLEQVLGFANDAELKRSGLDSILDMAGGGSLNPSILEQLLKGGSAKKITKAPSWSSRVTEAGSGLSTIVLRLGGGDSMADALKEIEAHRKAHRSWGVVRAVNHVTQKGIILLGLSCDSGSEEYGRMVENLKKDMPRTVEILASVQR
jgi:hypothetical protein